jgi:hypothetical protein
MPNTKASNPKAKYTTGKAISLDDCTVQSEKDMPQEINLE